MLKKYQVAEKQDNLWVVIEISSQMSMSWQIRGRLDAFDGVGYSTAAEAQERADDLNEGCDHEPTSNN